MSDTQNPKQGFFARFGEAFQDWDGFTSMTRIVAWIFTIVLSFSTLILAFRDHLHEINWPFASMVGACIFAVPIQGIARALVEWFKSHQGRKLLDKLISKVSGGAVDLTVSDNSEVTTTTTVNPSS